MLELDRRKFFIGLAASVVAAGVPLPIGCGNINWIKLGSSINTYYNYIAVYTDYDKTNYTISKLELAESGKTLVEYMKDWNKLNHSKNNKFPTLARMET